MAPTKKWWWAASWIVMALMTGLLVWYLRQPQDEIVLTGLTGTSLPTILLDGWKASCLNDERFNGADVHIGNMTPDPSCPSEASVFATDNAMEFLTPVTLWTASPTDSLKVAEHPVLPVPLNVWTLFGSTGDAGTHTTTTNAIYNTMQVGVQFSLTTHDESGQTTFEALDCADLGALKRTFPPVATMINVYYVSQVNFSEVIGGVTYTTHPRGRWCDNDPNIVLIGEYVDQTLAHELGHALSLGHADDWSGPSTNVMFSQPVNRKDLTIGQAFRMNVNTGSRINVNGTRVGKTRTCPDLQKDYQCPDIAK